MSEHSLTFTVHYYPADSIKVEIPLDYLTYGDLQVSYLKQAVGKALNLKDESLGIFGIYLGKLGDPKELCAEHYCVLDHTTDYCLLRLAPNKEEELRIISADEHALELVFWEVKFHYENNVFFSRPKKEIRRNMEYQKQFTQLVMSSKVLMSKLAEEYRLYRPHFKCSHQSLFVDVVRKIPLHYMSYYYVVEACCLKQTMEIDPPVKKGTKINIVMDSDRCVALDITGQHELASWTWDEVNVVDPLKRTLPSYYSATHTEEAEEEAEVEPKPGIHFATAQCMLVYTISKHFQKVYCSTVE